MSNCLIRWRWVRSHRRGLPFAREGVDGRVTGFIHVGSFRPNWFDGSPFLLHPSKVDRARVIALKNPEPRLTNPGVKLQWIVKTKVFLLAEKLRWKAFSSFLSTDQARRAQQKERNSLCGAFTGLASQEKKKSKSTFTTAPWLEASHSATTTRTLFLRAPLSRKACTSSRKKKSSVQRSHQPLTCNWNYCLLRPYRYSKYSLYAYSLTESKSKGRFLYPGCELQERATKAISGRNLTRLLKRIGTGLFVGLSGSS